MRLIQPNHGKIARRIVADHRRRHAPPVCERYGNAHRIMHHVAVSKDQSVGRKHESRAAALPLTRLSRSRAPSRLMHLNIHHRRAHAFNRTSDSRRIRVEQGTVISAPWRDGGPSRSLVPSHAILRQWSHYRGIGKIRDKTYILLVHAG